MTIVSLIVTNAARNSSIFIYKNKLCKNIQIKKPTKSAIQGEYIIFKISFRGIGLTFFILVTVAEQLKLVDLLAPRRLLMLVEVFDILLR